MSEEQFRKWCTVIFGLVGVMMACAIACLWDVDARLSILERARDAQEKRSLMQSAKEMAFDHLVREAKK